MRYQPARGGILSRIVLVGPILAIGAVFGPYVLPQFGLRLEQLVIYPLALLVCLARPRVITHPKRVPMKICAVWLFILGMSIATSLTIGRAYTDFSIIAAGIDDYLLPVAAIGICVASVREAQKRDGETERMVMTTFWATDVLLCLNSLVGCLQLEWPLTPYLQVFWTSQEMGPTVRASDSALSVAELSLTNGRVTGIFNQPMESGLVYSVGVFAWFYCVVRKKSLNLIDIVLLSLLVVGGLLSASKLFLLVGLPAFALLVLHRWMIGATKLDARRIIAFGIAIVIIGGSLMAVYLVRSNEIWSGGQYLIDALAGSDVIASISGGRFSSNGESLMGTLVDRISNVSPIAGVGFGFLPAVDSAYIYAYMTAGVFGVGAIALLILMLVLPAFRRGGGAEKVRDIRGIYVALVLFCALSGLGAPVFTLNRASTVLWVALTLLLCQMTDSMAKAPPTASGTGVVTWPADTGFRGQTTPGWNHTS